MSYQANSQQEIYSPEVQDIIGTPPNLIVRYGMSFFGFVAISLLFLSWWIHYPDAMTIPCTLSAGSPPIPILVPTNGRILKFYIKDKQSVKSNDVIATLEDVAKYEDVLQIKKTLNMPFMSLDISTKKNLNVGQLQLLYSNYIKSVKELKFFKSLNYHTRKISALKNKQSSLLLLHNQLYEQSKLNAKDIMLGEKIFKLDSNLYTRKGLTPYEYINSQRTYLREQSSFSQLKTVLVNSNVQLDEIRQAITDLELDQKEKERSLINFAQQSKETLALALKEWERRYVIYSVNSGFISYHVAVSNNHIVKAGELIATIIPSKAQNIFCKAYMPIKGSGKVSTGQKVRLRFDNFPSDEYGIVSGLISSIALTPNDKNIFVLIKLPEGLKTNYGTILPYRHDISGTAEIITADRRLIERIFDNLRSLINH